MLLYLKKTSLPSSYTDSSRDSTATNHTCSYKHWDHWYKFKQSFLCLIYQRQYTLLHVWRSLLELRHYTTHSTAVTNLTMQLQKQSLFRYCLSHCFSLTSKLFSEKWLNKLVHLNLKQAYHILLLLVVMLTFLTHANLIGSFRHFFHSPHDANFGFRNLWQVHAILLFNNLEMLLAIQSHLRTLFLVSQTGTISLLVPESGQSLRTISLTWQPSLS